ncbi:uncharacterized protein LOC144925163 isoform X2 [Branchiostoma floridae x Branchiostoma belcheri]
MESDAKEAMMVLGTGLVRPAPSPPPPRNLETGEGEAAPGSGQQDESSDSPDTPQAPNRRRDGGAKTPRLGFKDRVREVWRKLKSDACRVLLGCVLLLVAAAVITVGVSLALEETSALKHNKDIRMWEWSKKIVTPWETAFYKNNSTIAHLTLPPSGTRLEWAEPTLSARVNNEAVTTLITPVWTHGNNVTTATVVTPLLITDINECTSKPCQHGTCVNKDGGYKCTCSPGWTGQNCQQDINECTRNPCQHGRCVNKAGGYKCTCSAGWTGQNCQQDINECTRNPCQHGTCVNQDGGYKCTCSPGWTGQNCQQDINECTRNPCQHGTCVNQDGGYKCTCSPGWTGQNCQQDINECTSKPCQHGTCVNQDGGYKCTCSPGWTGQNCDIDLNECTKNPCQHGTCVNQDGGYKCTCSPGWTGQNCDIDLNECTKNPCQHGRCVNKDGGYKCTCSPGWTGQNCQQAKQCKSGWSEFENHCYRLYPDKVTWSKANWQCKQHNANLASIKNRAENDFITDLIKNAPYGTFVRKLVWFGMTQGGRWQWTDGSRVIYTNWAPGKPDQTWLTYFGMEEKCGCLYSKTEKSWLLPSGGEKGQWNNMKCMANYSYICKAPK